MSVKLVKSAEKEILKLQARNQQKIIDKLGKLAVDPLPRGSKKLKGFSLLYRVRCGDYRIVYEYDDADILILRVRHRSKVYDGL